MLRLSDIINRLRDQQGSALAIVALSMVVMLGMVALATDGGYLFVQRQKLVNAVDAAALAAAQELPVHPGAAVSVAYDVTANNGCTAGETGVTVAPNNRQVEVTALRHVPLFFARVLGINTSDVSARSKSSINPITSLKGAAPLSVAEQTFEYGIEYQLKDSPSEISDPAHGCGWYGPLSLGTTGATKYLENMKYGYQSSIKVGEVYDTETGNMDDPSSLGIAYRIAQCSHNPSCTYDHFSPDCTRILLIPVVQPIIISNQVKSVRIVSFAAFLVDQFVGAGKDSYIRGHFIPLVVSGDTDPGQVDSGLYGVKLEKY